MRIRIKSMIIGLINDDIFECKWQDVAGIHREGGTRLGTARSMAFKTKEGRRTAASNLLKVFVFFLPFFSFLFSLFLLFFCEKKIIYNRSREKSEP